MNRANVINNISSLVTLAKRQSHYTIHNEVVQKCAEFAIPQTLERIDLACNVQAISFKDISKIEPGESSAEIRKRVIAARQKQSERYKENCLIHCNAQMTDSMIQHYCVLDDETRHLLQMAMERLNLSARAYSRILKVARTIADLEGKENIEKMHVGEAVGYRDIDRADWAER